MYRPIIPFTPTFAGIGDFNLSLALQNSNSASYIFFSQLYYLFVDPTQSFPIPWDNSTAECNLDGETLGSGCSSYVFPGSLQAISNSSEWPVSNGVIFTRDSPSLRFEFWDLDSSDGNWTSDDCVIFGTGADRVGLCIGNSVIYKNALTAGLIYLQYTNILD